MAKTLFIAPGPYTWASTRMRAAWPAKYMQNAEWIEIAHLAQKPEVAEQFDNLVWCKRVETAVIDKYPDKRHIWDICDPVYWWEPQGCREMLDKFQLLTASCQGLANDFSNWAGRPVLNIRDRLDLEHYNLRHEHAHTEPLRFIWYGASQNRFSLIGAVCNLERLAANGVQFELTIMDDKPGDVWNLEAFPVYHVPFSVEHEVRIIAQHDIAILPDYPGAWGRVKSNNRMLTAWACNVAATKADEYDELYQLATITSARVSNAGQGLANVIDLYDVRQTAAEWERQLA